MILCLQRLKEAIIIQMKLKNVYNPTRKAATSKLFIEQGTIESGTTRDTSSKWSEKGLNSSIHTEI